MGSAMVAGAVRSLAALVPVALAVAAPLLAGCDRATEGRLCTAQGACTSGYCVAGRCRPLGAVPSPSDARRVLLPPEDIAVVASRGDRAAGAGLPDAIALGRASRGDVVVLLRFAATWRDDAQIASAFVVLAPVRGAPPAADAVTLEVARITSPWRSETATWGRAPRLDLPSATAVVRQRPEVPLRIDVTPLVRDWAKRRRDDHGIAIRAAGEAAYGAAYSLGGAHGEGPLLEVYLR